MLLANKIAGVTVKDCNTCPRDEFCNASRVRLGDISRRFPAGYEVCCSNLIEEKCCKLNQLTCIRRSRNRDYPSRRRGYNRRDVVPETNKRFYCDAFKIVRGDLAACGIPVQVDEGGGGGGGINRVVMVTPWPRPS